MDSPKSRLEEIPTKYQVLIEENEKGDGSLEIGQHIILFTNKRIIVIHDTTDERAYTRTTTKHFIPYALIKNLSLCLTQQRHQSMRPPQGSHTITLELSGIEPLCFTTDAHDVGPVWSPDVRRIAFSSERDGNPEIYVMNADGSGATRLTYNGARDLVTAWSPDGPAYRVLLQSRQRELGHLRDERRRRARLRHATHPHLSPRDPYASRSGLEAVVDDDSGKLGVPIGRHRQLRLPAQQQHLHRRRQLHQRQHEVASQFLETLLRRMPVASVSMIQKNLTASVASSMKEFEETGVRASYLNHTQIHHLTCGGGFNGTLPSM